MSSILLPRPLPLWVATIWPARPASAIGTQRTVKPSGSSSARIIRPTASTPGEVQRAAVLVHQPLEQGEASRLLGVDGLDDLLLGGGELGRGGGGEKERGRVRGTDGAWGAPFLPPHRQMGRGTGRRLVEG